MKIAVFAEDEPGAVRDGEDGFGSVAGLEIPAVDAVTVDEFDPHDEMGLEHRMRHGPDRDFGAAVARRGHRDMLLARAVGMVFDESDEAPSAARRDAVVAAVARLKRLQDHAAFGAFPDRIRFFHRVSP